MTTKELLARYAAGQRDFSGVNLSGGNLTGANLSGADLSKADLTGADLTGANLSEACMTGAIGIKPEPPPQKKKITLMP